MKRTTRLLAVGISAVALLTLCVPPAQAQTSDDFKTMKELLEKQGGQIQELLKGRAEDQQKIQHLEQLVGETQKKAEQSQQTATTAQQKAEETQKATADVAEKVQTIQSAPSEEASAKSHLQLTGYAHMLYQKTEGENGSFLVGAFNPIFLYRAGDRVLFEGELEVELENKSGGGMATPLALEYATVDYLVNDYLTVVAGKMIMPLGTFMEKTHPAWINKLPTFPQPRETRLLPHFGVGLQLRGAVPMNGDHQLNYALYGVNGPGSKAGTGNAADIDLKGDAEDMNNAPSVGGRIGWFHPWKPYHDIELGVSGQTGEWDDSSSLLWSAVVVDATLHLGPNFEARGEYIRTWQDTKDAGTIQPHGWWAQAAYKLAGLNLELPVINNLEGVFRYSTQDTIDRGGSRTDGYALGLVYYFSSQLQTKAAYEFMTSTESSEANNRLLLEVAYGF